MQRFLYVLALLLLVLCGVCAAQNGSGEKYKLLATTRTSTMQKEIDENSAQGYRIIVGSPTSDSEMVLFLSKVGTIEAPYKYKLLATTRTGTMQKELNEAAADGFRLIPSTMIAKKQLLGGVEVVMIMEQPPEINTHYEYKLLATTRTSTLQKEVTEAQEAGFRVIGMVSRDEHMVVMEREDKYLFGYNKGGCASRSLFLNLKKKLFTNLFRRRKICAVKFNSILAFSQSYES